MSVIIRLQGLPWTANALDIRQYFAGLTIPEGGVHIVGGDDGDAFIAFSSDEDARQAMLMDGGRIKETAKVKLLLSSRTEMQRVIDVARNRNLVMQGLLAAAAAAKSTAASPAATAAAAASSVGVGLGTSMSVNQQLQTPSTTAAAKQAAAAELFMNRAAAMMPVGQQMQMQQPFQLQQLKLSTMEMLQGDMRQLMMQNMGLQQTAGIVGGGGGGGGGGGAGGGNVVGGGAQSMLPNAGNMSMGMSSSPSYEPTKKSTAIGDRDQLMQRVEAAERDLATRDRDRDREREREQRDQRDRSDNLNNNSSRSRWTSRNDRRGSRSPRRRSRDRDGGGSSSRRRSDRRRSVSRGRSREKSNDRSRNTATSSSSAAASAARSGGGGGIDPFVTDLRNDVDNRRSSRTATTTTSAAAVPSTAPSNVGVALNGGGGGGGSGTQVQQLPSSDSPMPSSRWEGAQVLDPEPTSDNMSMANRMQERQQDSAPEMRSWDRDLIDQPSQMFRDQNLGIGGPRIGLHDSGPPFNLRQQQMTMPLGVAGNNNNLNSERRPSSCVVMRGIPFDTHPFAIRDYFQGLNIPPEGIRLLVDTIGNRPHLAFVRFTNEFDRDIVLKRVAHYFQGLLVEVLPCTEEEFLRIPSLQQQQQQQPVGGGLGGAMGSEIDVWSPRGPNLQQQQQQRSPFNHQMMEEENCLFVKGMPFKCVEKDIYEFFDGFRIVDALVEYLRPGKSAGTGFAEFASPLEARRALELDGQKMDFRNIELRLSTKESMMTARRQTDENLDGGRMSIDRQFPQAPPVMMPSAASNNNNNNQNDLFGRFDCCLITGLPLSATDRDILEFFSPADIAPVVIHVMLDTASRPMGDAFCEFNNPHECQMAVQMDGRPLRNTPAGAKFLLRIRPVSRMELNAALGAIAMGPPTGGGGGGGPMSGLSTAPSNASPSIGAPPNNQRSNGGPLNAVPFAAANTLSPSQKQPTGPLSGAIPVANNGAIVSPTTAMGAAQLSSPGKQAQLHLTPNMQQRPMGPSFFGRPSEPGCILEVQNLPFLSTSEDILQHFKGFGLTKESIMRRFRENGAPTGDARLLFHNSKDTQMAYRQLNSVMMGGRVLNLKILS